MARAGREGLKTLTIANSPASMALWVSEAMRQRSEMPQDIQDALNKHEKAGDLQRPRIPEGHQPGFTSATSAASCPSRRK